MRVKVVALMAWYRELPHWLEHSIATLRRAGVTDLIAIDGAYALFPDAEARSTDAEHRIITTTAQQAGLGLELHIPDEPWSTEIDKRNHLFHLGEQLTTEDDWYFVVDADELVQRGDPDLHAKLGQDLFHVGQCTLVEPHPTKATEEHAFPMYFRAIRGLKVVGNHYTYATPDGRFLWGRADGNRLEPRIPLDVRVLHRTHFRSSARRAAAQAYYDRREEMTAEEALHRPVARPAPC